MAAADEERLVTRITETVLATLLPLLGKSGAPGTAAAAAAAAANTGSDDPEWVDVDSRAALVCDPDPSFAAQAAEALRDLGYVPQVAPDLRTAWKLLDKHFAVVAVSDALADDPQGGAKVLDRLSRLPGPKRRAMFVALVSPDVQTMDGGLAFVSNANMTIARADAAQLRDVLRKGLRDRDKMYRPFLAALEAAAGSH
jgi:CheY-like chemotaxis protein